MYHSNIQKSLKENDLKYNLIADIFYKNGHNEQAKKLYLRSLESGHSYSNSLLKKIHFNLSIIYSAEGQDEYALNHLKNYIIIEPKAAEPYNNIAAILMKNNKIMEALNYIEKSIKLNNNYSDAYYNLGVILRLLGKQKEAIEYFWKLIKNEIKKQDNVDISFEIMKYQPIKEINIYRNRLTIVFIKWGNKYNAEYVNKLYHSIKRYTKKLNKYLITFKCFTDDSTGLLKDIEIHSLPKALKGWWNKAYLFSFEANLLGRIIYIDLDTVITGSLHDIFLYQGTFGVLGTEYMLNEKKRKNGLNTSIMIWEGGNYQNIYNLLYNHLHSITKYLYKFDHWIEMMISNYDILQNLFKGKIIEYNSLENQKVVSLDVSIVCFPLRPKPHEYTSEWIQYFWKMDE